MSRLILILISLIGIYIFLLGRAEFETQAALKRAELCTESKCRIIELREALLWNGFIFASRSDVEQKLFAQKNSDQQLFALEALRQSIFATRIWGVSAQDRELLAAIYQEREAINPALNNKTLSYPLPAFNYSSSIVAAFLFFVFCAIYAAKTPTVLHCSTAIFGVILLILTTVR